LQDAKDCVEQGGTLAADGSCVSGSGGDGGGGGGGESEKVS